MRRLAVAAVLPVLLLLPACGAEEKTVPGPASTPAVAGLPAADPVAAIRSGEYAVIDVRTPAEFSGGHVRGALNIDLHGDFDAGVAALPRDGRYVVYCRSGNRSAQARSRMLAAGFTTVLDAGGFAALRDAGVPVA